MVVAGMLVGQRQRRWIEDACLAPEEPEQARRFLDTQPGEGAFAQRTIEQKDTRGGIERAKPQCRPLDGIGGIERGQGIGFSEGAERHQEAFTIVMLRAGRAG